MFFFTTIINIADKTRTWLAQ